MGIIVVSAVALAVIIGTTPGAAERLASWLRPVVCHITEGHCESHGVGGRGSGGSPGGGKPGGSNSPGSSGNPSTTHIDPNEPAEPCVRSSEQKVKDESFNFLVVGHHESSSSTVEHLSDGSVRLTSSNSDATGLDLRAGADIEIGGRKGKGVSLEGGFSSLDKGQDINTWTFDDDQEFRDFQADVVEALKADFDNGDWDFPNVRRVTEEEHPPAITTTGGGFDTSGKFSIGAFGAYFSGEPQGSSGTLTEINHETGERTFTRFDQSGSNAGLGWLVGGVGWDEGTVNSTSITVDRNDKPTKLTMKLSFAGSGGLDGLADFTNIKDIPSFVKSATISGSDRDSKLTEIELTVPLDSQEVTSAALAMFFASNGNALDRAQQILAGSSDTKGETIVRQFAGSKSTGGFEASIGAVLSLGGGSTSETTSLSLTDAFYRVPGSNAFQRWGSCVG
jgi:hypothetical protein